jgi:hypothetical protein
MAKRMNYGLGAEEPRFDWRQVQDTFLHSVQTGSGAHPAPVLWVSGSFSRRVKLPVCEADHATASSAEAKNVWSYISAPPTF